MWLKDGPAVTGHIRAMLTPTSIHSFTQAAGTGQLFAAGTWLRERNKVYSTVLYLRQGRVLLGTGDASQLRHQIGALQGPTWLDAAFALQGRSSCLDMLADSEVWVDHISVHDFLDCVGKLPQTAQSLLRDMAQTYCAQSDLAVSRLAQDAEARCAQWLLQHATPDGSTGLRVVFQLRKRLIAAQLGIAPETFSRVLRQLRERGLIEGVGNVIALVQPRSLQSLAAG